MLFLVVSDVSIDGKVHMIYLVLNIKVCGAVNYAAQCRNIIIFLTIWCHTDVPLAVPSSCYSLPSMDDLDLSP